MTKDMEGFGNGTRRRNRDKSWDGTSGGGRGRIIGKGFGAEHGKRWEVRTGGFKIGSTGKSVGLAVAGTRTVAEHKVEAGEELGPPGLAA